MKKEVKYYLKANRPLIFLHAILLAFSLMLVVIFLHFTVLTSEQLSRFEDNFEGKTMYTIFDDLFSGQSGRVYWSEEKVERIALFYDILNQRSDIHFLSVDSNPVPIRSFRGGAVFDFSYGTQWLENESNEIMDRDVKAVQMNQQAFEFFDLEVAEGEMFSWLDVDYSNRSIPILLGYHYQGIYEIGDILITDYPFESFRPFELEVYGFLAQDTHIFHRYQPNYFLDHYILIPHPYSVLDYDTTDLRAKGFLALAMIHGDIIVSNSADSLEFVLNVLDIVGQESGFHDYAISGVAFFAIHFTRMISILSYNARLIQAILGFCIAIVFLISIQISKYIFAKRKHYYHLLHTLGLSYKLICKLIFREIMCTFTRVSILLFFSLYLFYTSLYPIGFLEPLHLIFYPMFLLLYMNLEILIIIGIQMALIALTYLSLKSELKKNLSKE